MWSPRCGLHRMAMRAHGRQTGVRQALIDSSHNAGLGAVLTIIDCKECVQWLPIIKAKRPVHVHKRHHLVFHARSPALALCLAVAQSKLMVERLLQAATQPTSTRKNEHPCRCPNTRDQQPGVCRQQFVPRWR